MSTTESFVFYESFYEAIELLPQEEQLEAYRAITVYALKGEEIAFESVGVKMIFTMAKPNIDSAKNKRENGKKGGRPQKENGGRAQEKTASKKEKSKKENEKTNGFENENHWFAESESNVDVNGNVDTNVNIDFADYVDEEDLTTTTAEEEEHAREGGDELSTALTRFCDKIVTNEDKEKVIKLTNMLCSVYWRRKAHNVDSERVFRKVMRHVFDDGVAYEAVYDIDNEEMLKCAFSLSYEKGHETMNWAYVESIYADWNSKGFKTVADVARHENSRKSNYYY